MSEESKGGIEAGYTDETVDQDIDPELVDDRDTNDGVDEEVELPDYDESLFEFPDEEFEDEDDE